MTLLSFVDESWAVKDFVSKKVYCKQYNFLDNFEIISHVISNNISKT